MPDQNSDNYNLDEDTHKLSGLGTSGSTWNGSTENTDVQQGYNKPYAHVWWVDKDTNKVTYYGNKGEVTYRHFTVTSSSGVPADQSTQDGTITGKNDGGAIDHNLEFLEIDNSYLKIKEAQTPRNADINTTVAMKTRYTKNTAPEWAKELNT
jgi:hypothetical protein